MDDSVIPGICAGLLGGVAVALFLRARVFLGRADSAEAEVVALRAYREQRTTRYAQVCRFEAEGRAVEAELKAGLPYQTGDRIRVVFDRARPEKIYTKATLYRPGMITLIIALLVGGVWLASR